MSNTTDRHDAYASLRIGDFRLFISFRFFMIIAIQMQSLIIGWQVYELTKDPLALGLIGLVEAVPFIVVALYAGHVADRFNRKRIILLFLLLFIVGTIILLLFSFDLQRTFRMIGIYPFYVTVAVSGICRAFIYPATIALMAQIVPREHYANSSTWNSTIWHIGAITGPAMGGLIYGFLGVTIAYMTVVFMMLVALILLIVVTNKPVPVYGNNEKLFERLKSGLRFVFKNQILFASMSLDMFAVLFGGAIAMLPVFASEVLKVGPQGLGFLRAAPMAGAVVMSFLIAYRPPMAHAGKNLLFAVAGFGVSIILFAISRNFYLSLGLLFISGLFDNISVIIRSTTMQLVTPDEMRGRVASINSIFIGSSNEIGSFESGLAAKLMGLIPSVIFGGVMTLVIVGITAKAAPVLRRLNLMFIP